MASAGGAEAEKAEGQEQAVRQPRTAGAEQRAAEQPSQRPGEQMVQRNRRIAEHQARGLLELLQDVRAVPLADGFAAF